MDRLVRMLNVHLDLNNMENKTKDQLLIDILNIMKRCNKSNDDMSIVIQSYISEFGFLDEKGSEEVRRILY